MYQSVGHQAVELYAEAMGLPLFRQRTNGVALQLEKIYTHTPEDEVEDLFDLLVNIKVCNIYFTYLSGKHNNSVFLLFVLHLYHF